MLPEQFKKIENHISGLYREGGMVLDQTTMELVKSQGVWAVLFVALLIGVGKWALKTIEENRKREDEHRADSKAREELLMKHNEGYQNALAELSAGQQRLTDAVMEMRADIAEVKVDIEDLKRA